MAQSAYSALSHHYYCHFQNLLIIWNWNLVPLCGFAVKKGNVSAPSPVPRGQLGPSPSHPMLPASPLPCRCVFMRLATICVLVFTLGSKITSCDSYLCELCGYNQKLYPVRLGGRASHEVGHLVGVGGVDSIKIERTAHGARVWIPDDPLSCCVHQELLRAWKPKSVLELRGVLAGGLQRHRIGGWKWSW